MRGEASRTSARANRVAIAISIVPAIAEALDAMIADVAPRHIDGRRAAAQDRITGIRR